jgi:hypothetical protein
LGERHRADARIRVQHGYRGLDSRRGEQPGIVIQQQNELAARFRDKAVSAHDVPAGEVVAQHAHRGGKVFYLLRRRRCRAVVEQQNLGREMVDDRERRETGTQRRRSIAGGDPDGEGGAHRRTAIARA